VISPHHQCRGCSFEGALLPGMSLRARVDWCLEDVRERMQRSPGKLWIMKPSLTNKGAVRSRSLSYQCCFRKSSQESCS
jgi:hypothetical protein